MDNDFEKDEKGFKPDSEEAAQANENEELTEKDTDLEELEGSLEDETTEENGLEEDDVFDETKDTELVLENDNKSFIQRWKEKELAKEASKKERYEKSEERMKAMREERIAEMYADGKEPNKLQKFLMAEGKYVNYENKNGVVLFCTVVIGIIIFILVAMNGFISKEKFGLGKTPSRAIVYSSGNDLYCYDLKGEPVLISESLSAGGSASYSYVGNGITVAEDGKSVYFIDNVAADGTFDLNYYESGKKNAPSKISQGVSDYEISSDGGGAVYVVSGESGSTGKLYGYSKKANASYEIADGIGISGTEYSISADGQKVVFAKVENNSVSLNICNIDGTKLSAIDTDVAQYLVTSHGNNAYYIKAVGADNGVSVYNVYLYDLKKGTSQLIDEDVAAVTLSPDENAVIYYKNSGAKIMAKDIINDDGDDSEATNALRKEIETYEFNDITCTLYRYEDGKSEMVNEGIFTAMPADKKGEYIAYTVPSGIDKIKINLSEISSVNDIVSLYYSKATSLDLDTYIYKLNGYSDYVTFENSYIYSFENSANNSQMACFVDYDSANQRGKLILSTYDENGIKSYGELEDDVASYDFMGDGSRIVYLRGVDDSGMGTLKYIESNVPDEISTSAYYYEVSDDLNRRVFYLDNYDSTTFGGTFHYYQQGTDTVVDDGVYMFAYRSNNNALYMKNYNASTATGDLYYLNGKTSKLVAEGVSSVFDFYDSGR